MSRYEVIVEIDGTDYVVNGVDLDRLVAKVGRDGIAAHTDGVLDLHLWGHATGEANPSLDVDGLASFVANRAELGVFAFGEPDA